jgi:hypothetical protein
MGQIPMNPPQFTPLEPGNRIQLPAEWTESFGLHHLVSLEKTADGILVRPCPRTTWAEISATKLVIGSAPSNKNDDDMEVTGDDFLF